MATSRRNISTQDNRRLSNAVPEDSSRRNSVAEEGARRNSNAGSVNGSRRNSSASPYTSRRNSSATSDDPGRRNSNAISEDVVPNIKEIIKRKSKKNPGQSALINYLLMTAVFLITMCGYPLNWDAVSSHHVFYYGWLTAVSTGLGVVPFFFISEPNKFWMGVSNGKCCCAFQFSK